ncbi:MAG: hypothetical protein OEM02_00035 [Desulfobulbaceae bacterium]|nr:hypothetical protein [Desulfobulbaceae bacterium]
MKSKLLQKQDYIWLALGTVLLYFSNWNWAIPAATWLFSIFLLRFSRTRPIRSGLLGLGLASLVVGVASMWKLLAIEPIPPIFRIVSGLVLGVIVFLPFLADRLLVYKVPPMVATVVFPCSWAGLEYLKAMGNGTWGALAYTQYGNQPFMQLASITGLWGFSFLITWFGSVVNFAWEQHFAWRKINSIIITYSLILCAVYLYGYARLSGSLETVDRVSVATVTNPDDFVKRFYSPDWTDRKRGYKNMEKDLAHFIASTKKSVNEGAQIVLWQEYSICVMEENEGEFMGRVQKLAMEEQIYLVVAIGLFPIKYPEQPWQNKLMWIDPSGEVIAQYNKLKPAPPLEPITPGTEPLPIADTSYGKIGSIICADLDYPNIVRQVSGHKGQLLLIAAQSWAAVDPLHTQMAVFRAIENGLPVVMGTGGGLSIAVDSHGRQVTSLDSATTPEKRMISSLPLKPIATIYSRIGDSFAWVSILGFMIIALLPIFVGKRGKCWKK